ncbi:MAG: hypothetical protein ABW152_01365 [Candidatus Thiodiazotropha endolucinida]
MSNNNDQPHGPGADSHIRIPAPAGSQLELRIADILQRDRYNPHGWRRETLTPVSGEPGWFEVDLNNLGLEDGDYEYKFIKDGAADDPIADPYAIHITRFGGYRGIFQIRDGRRWQQPFSWDDEFTPGNELRNNHQLVIYEMPMRWMESAPEKARQVGLGTFEKVVFAHLDRLKTLGINAIELLPVQDSPDTLIWGYGSRFFFVPDIDMGLPVELKFFIKLCHRAGPGFYNLSQVVNYLTSHDVGQEEEKRIMNYLLAPLLDDRGYRDTVNDIRRYYHAPGRRRVWLLIRFVCFRLEGRCKTEDKTFTLNRAMGV